MNNEEDYFGKNHYINYEMEMKGTLSGCYYKGHGRRAVPCWPQLTSPGLLVHTRRNSRRPSASPPPGATRLPADQWAACSQVLSKILFDFCTAISGEFEKCQWVASTLHLAFRQLHVYCQYADSTPCIPYNEYLECKIFITTQCLKSKDPPTPDLMI